MAAGAVTSQTAPGISPLPLGVASLLLLLLSVAFFVLRRGRGSHGGKKVVPMDGKVQEAEEEGAGSRKRALVLYATQTGTAEGFAKTLGDEARKRYNGQVLVPVVKVDDYAESASDFEEKLRAEALVLFVVATYGDGEPTDDATTFYKWLTSRAETDDCEEVLSGVSYAVFGLGNRQYEHFNVVGITTDKSLSKLGGKRIVEVGLGDDDKCIEDDFLQWREALWAMLDPLLQGEGAAPIGEQDSAAGILEYKVEFFSGLQREVDMAKEEAARPLLRRAATKKGAGADLPLFRAPVAVRRELHSPLSERSCVHVELDISGSGITYEAGDHVALYSQNLPQVVEAAASLLGVPLDTVFRLHQDPPPDQPANDQQSAEVHLLQEPFPGPCSLRTALSCFADLLNSPKKSALLALAAHATNPEEAERLRFLASPAGKEDYQREIASAHRSLLEVMASFPSSKPPLGVFFAAIAPRLQPRFYSISSSPRSVGESIHVTCSVVEEMTPGGRLHQGVCSTWLKRAVPLANAVNGLTLTHVPLYVRSSEFRLPKNPKTPIVMVGPGTGLAPFRGFLQERSALRSEGHDLGPALLFFGCRNSQKDFIYREELEEFERDGIISEFRIAFSRDGPEKKYVQHLLQAQASRVWSLLAEGGHLYVCGDAKAMARDVHRTLHTIVKNEECVSTSEAEAIVKKLQSEKRYLRDVW